MIIFTQMSVAFSYPLKEVRLYMPRGRKKGSSRKNEEFFSEIGRSGGKSSGKGRNKQEPKQEQPKESEDQGAFDLWSIDE
jgi:general stress protein YciG